MASLEQDRETMQQGIESFLLDADIEGLKKAAEYISHLEMVGAYMDALTEHFPSFAVDDRLSKILADRDEAFRRCIQKEVFGEPEGSSEEDSSDAPRRRDGGNPGSGAGDSPQDGEGSTEGTAGGWPPSTE